MGGRTCPTCRGSGVLPEDPRDTTKMSRAEFDAMLAGAVRTPKPPPPENPYPPVVIPLDPFPDERATLPSDTWMTKRVRRLQKSNMHILTLSVGLMGLILGALAVLATRGC